MTTSLVLYQTPVQGTITGYRPVLTLGDMHIDAGEYVETLEWLHDVLNDEEQRATYGFPPEAPSISTGDVVYIDRGEGNGDFYMLTPVGWAITAFTPQ